jgi:hypothetical protein
MHEEPPDTPATVPPDSFPASAPHAESLELVRCACRCGFTSPRRHWFCPKCRSVLLGDRPILLASLETILVGAIVVPIVTSESARGTRVIGLSLYLALVVYFWASAIRLRRFNRAYEASMQRIAEDDTAAKRRNDAQGPGEDTSTR